MERLRAAMMAKGTPDSSRTPTPPPTPPPQPIRVPLLALTDFIPFSFYRYFFVIIVSYFQLANKDANESRENRCPSQA